MRFATFEIVEVHLLDSIYDVQILIALRDSSFHTFFLNISEESPQSSCQVCRK